MPTIDFERSWLRMKEAVLSKSSHGQRDLLAEMARIELECEIPEDQEGFDPRPPRPRPSLTLQEDRGEEDEGQNRSTSGSDEPSSEPAASGIAYG